jgi:glycosyltransferase involved in cell wall biosynthesis
MQACPGYRWRGALPHDAVRDAIQRAHVLVHPSRMEGGANVVIEAITSGTPVLASAVDGNIGLLGEDYPGYFPWGDAPSLAAMLTRLRLELTTGNALLRQLTPAIAARAPLFEPEHERQCVRQLVTDLHRR